jgi:hypothetical protein
MNSSTTALAAAKAQILSPGGMDERSIEAALGQMGAHKIDGGDLYFELTRGEAWSLEEGLVKSGSYYIRRAMRPSIPWTAWIPGPRPSCCWTWTPRPGGSIPASSR